MTNFSRMFNSAAARKTMMIGAVVIGTAGILSGAWQAYVHGPATEAGLFGGAVSLAIGSYGLFRLRRKEPPTL